ncbi:MAG TPA: EAL domain-containing protein [Gammaproteobacteria bacterium]|jgi:diguanylate cyclase (GGDEF)-like protein|nr:EAL domain-containing protein [Gammaproteobacteria bacterium]
MKLRNKVLIAIGIVWLIFLALTYIGSRVFLIQSFLKLEQNRADDDLGRVDQALDQVNYALYTFTSDWSHWNDLYSYIQGKEPEFVPNNLNITAYVNSHINLMTFWDKTGKFVLGTAVDTDKKQLIGFPQGLEKYIYPGSLLSTRKDANKELRGFVLTSAGVMLVAACSITDGDKLLPPLGASIFGRNLDPALVAKIEDTTKVTLQLFTLNQIKQSPTLEKYFSVISKNKNGHISSPIDKKTLEGFTVIKDIYGKPIAMFRMITPRSIYDTGWHAVNYYLMTFVVLGILFSLLIIWLLRALIIKRLEKLDHEVADIGAKNAISQRVDASGTDELSSVSNEINGMLDIIQASHDQLEQRVLERTKELQKANLQLQQEITERKSVERELVIHKEHLVRLAHYDSLTSLPNRVFFNEILNKAIHHAKRHDKVLAILFVDLDRFKNINDALGHPTGDLVLKEIGNRFASILRVGDILARLGGDEFIILLNDIGDAKYAGSVAEKILKICAQPVKIENHEFFITASVGICIFPNDGQSLEDLHKNADMAMYKAKRSGGGVYQFYTKEMNIAAHEHIKLEAALRKAIQNKEFVLYYQPQLNLKDGTIQRVEALIRWESEHGLISPAKFIPLAEETGLILPIGEWTLYEACRTAKKWQDEGYQPITVAVNISPKQFRHQDLAQIVADVLKETQLDPKYLEVEITETAVMDDVDIAITRLNNISAMGVRISVDDFGTGYTSISYLKQFPVSVLKIDQHFIKGIPYNQNDLAITSAVIALGHNLGMEVIAEGVETAEQMQYLAEHDCDLIQGYFLSRPLPENKIVLQFIRGTEARDSIIEIE